MKEQKPQKDRRNIVLMAAAVLMIAALLPFGGILKAHSAVKEEAVKEEEKKISVPEGLSCEVKFLLDPEKVLDEGQHLKQEWEQAFGITEEWRPIDVMYLETPDRDFQQEGWINRLRWKSGKKKAERTYKKRYPVTDMDIAAACEAAAKDGFRISGKGTEPDGEKGFEAQLDWGYEEMNLSFNLDSNAALKGHDSLASVTEAEAKDFMKNAMPEEEADWKESHWGIGMIDRSRIAGPVRSLRTKGTLRDTEITVEIWPIDEKKGSCMVELSFEEKDFQKAADLRAELTAYFDEEGILLHEDSLKTKEILDNWL